MIDDKPAPSLRNLKQICKFSNIIKLIALLFVVTIIIIFIISYVNMQKTLNKIKNGDTESIESLKKDIDSELREAFKNSMKNDILNDLKISFKNEIKSEMEKELKYYIQEDLKNDVKEDIKEQTKSEIKDYITNVLKTELKNDVKNEVENDIQNRIVINVSNEIESEVKKNIINDVKKEIKYDIIKEATIEIEGNIKSQIKNEITEYTDDVIKEKSKVFITTNDSINADKLQNQQICNDPYCVVGIQKNGKIFSNIIFTKGMIIAWFGQISQIPENWAICDGTQGTPDLRNRFILGNENDENIGKTGGENNIIINKSNLPKIGKGYFSSDSHNGNYHHKSNGFIKEVSAYSVGVKNGGGDDWGSNLIIDLEDGMNSSPIDIMNPYYYLFYIMKL